jgi:hypothetical protein
MKNLLFTIQFEEDTEIAEFPRAPQAIAEHVKEATAHHHKYHPHHWRNNNTAPITPDTITSTPLTPTPVTPTPVTPIPVTPTTPAPHRKWYNFLISL